jgi:DNA transposition AAA+ family ATPase
MSPTSRPMTDYLGKASAAWHGAAPDWIVALAEACAKSSQSAVAKKVGYSAPTISAVLGNSYRGDMNRVETMVRGRTAWQCTAPAVMDALTAATPQLRRLHRERLPVRRTEENLSPPW